MRDARINMTYEGTNTIQSLDLLGRKVLGDGGAKLKEIAALIQAFATEEMKNPEMHEFITPLAYAGEKLNKITMEVGMKAMKNPDEVGSAAVDYLRICGHLIYGYFWARMASVALKKKDSGDPFYKAKLVTARFYFAKIYPEISMLVRTIEAGSATLMEMEEDWF